MCIFQAEIYHSELFEIHIPLLLAFSLIISIYLHQLKSKKGGTLFNPVIMWAFRQEIIPASDDFPCVFAGW